MVQLWIEILLLPSALCLRRNLSTFIFLPDHIIISQWGSLCANTFARCINAHCMPEQPPHQAPAAVYHDIKKYKKSKGKLFNLICFGTRKANGQRFRLSPPPLTADPLRCPIRIYFLRNDGNACKTAFFIPQYYISLV